jgi:hypothetical protein
LLFLLMTAALNLTLFQLPMYLSRLCHVVIYYHDDKKHPCLVGIGLSKDSYRKDQCGSVPSISVAVLGLRQDRTC